jgi:hypothetical protein
MNITQAKAAMRRLIGTKAMWRYDEKAPDADERAQLHACLPTFQKAREAAKVALQERRAELLVDPEYLRLKQRWEIADKEVSQTMARAHHYRVTVGRDSGFAFTVMAEGDNWQDAIDKLKEKEAQ